MIAPAGDDDLFAVTLVSGFAYQFDLLGQGSGSNTLPGATFSLVGTGKTATAGSSGDARISYTASSSGTYYFDVSAGATSTGSYTLSAQPADDYGDTASTTTGKLAIGGSTTGVIAPAGDDDLFAVTLVSGFAYQFDLLGQGSGSNTLPGATFSLVGTGKTATAGSSGDARISYTASSSGTYYSRRLGRRHQHRVLYAECAAGGRLRRHGVDDNGQAGDRRQHDGGDRTGRRRRPVRR